MNTAISERPGTTDTLASNGNTIIHPTSSTRSGVLGGVGGLAFASSVLIQNVLRSKFPSNDVGAAEVMSYYSDHRSVTMALAVLMPLGLVGLTTFLGAVIARVARGAGRAAAVTGAFGAAGIIATFTILTAFDMAIAGYIHRGAADLAVVDGLWVVHNAVFGLLLASIGVAVGGLSRAATVTGLLSRRWKPVGMVAGFLLVVGAMTTPAIIEGSPTMFIGVAGFVGWLAFIIRTSVALVRQPQH